VRGVRQAGFHSAFGMRMNHNSSLAQNLASGGGMLPICALFLYLSARSQHAEQLVRIGINTLTAVVCLLLCYALFELMRDQNSGHRWLNGYMLLHFASTFLVHSWIVWKWLMGSQAHLPLVVSVLQNTTLIAFGLYFFTTRHDLQKTLQTSEAEKLANLHRIEQSLQAAVLLEYKVNHTPVRSPLESEKFMELATNVGRRR
jgi:hypothetical protein